LATGADLAIITAHPFDMSTTKQQAAIKKVEATDRTVVLA
jgi:hypothetical protein